MSEENVEIVRGLLDTLNAFWRGELSGDALAEPWDPEIEVLWHNEQTYPDTPQQLQGAQDLVAFSEQFRSDWVDAIQELLELHEAPGGRVMALISQSARGRQSGVPIVIHFFEIFTIRDGKLRRIEYFRHRADALDAAGLSE
jgi:ketosteroid isomerase-like protein